MKVPSYILKYLIDFLKDRKFRVSIKFNSLKLGFGLGQGWPTQTQLRLKTQKNPKTQLKSTQINSKLKNF